MTTLQTGRRLVWHGVLLVLLGLFTGFTVSLMANPRMGVSAHVGALLNGVLLIALGAGWQQIWPAPRREAATFWLLIFGSYGGSLGVLLAAVLGTRESTPIHGAVAPAAAWAEALVAILLWLTAPAMLAGIGLVLHGARRSSGGRRAEPS